MNVMPITELIDKVTEICKANGVKRLDLFGSFATGTFCCIQMQVDGLYR